MLCSRPFMRGTVPFGCGQCLPCRINRRRQWMWRQYLESITHDENCFVTLTYASKWLPSSGDLEPEVLRLAIGRVRAAIAPIKIRFFAVGEYGGQSLRPHYHLSLFGVSGDTILHSYGRPRFFRDIMFDCWGRSELQGYMCAEFNELTAQYVSGYVTKKYTDLLDSRLEGKVPEFARMSRRPGIGRAAMGIVAESLIASGFGRALVEDIGDVPRSLKIGRRSIPLGRYLLSALRESVGFTEAQIKEIKSRATYESQTEMSALLEASLNSQELGSAKQIYLEGVKQKILQTETRNRIWRKNETL